MPMSSDQIDDLKANLSVAKKRDVSFGICVAPKPDDTVFLTHRVKDGKALAKQAKQQGSGTKSVHGTMIVDGRALSLKCDKEPPGNLAENVSKLLRKNGMTLSVTAVFGNNLANADLADDDEEAGLSDDPHPKAGEWIARAKSLGAALDASMGQLPEGGTLRGQWEYARTAGEQGDIPGALKAAEKIEGDLKKALKAHGKAQVERVMKGFDKVKAGLTDDDRKEIRVLVGAMVDDAGRISAPDMAARADAAIRTLAAKVKETRKGLEGDKPDIAEAVKDIDRQITALLRDVEKLEKQVSTVETQIKDANDRLNGSNRPKKKQADALQQRIDKLETELTEKRQALAEKRKEVQPAIDTLTEAKDQTAKALQVKMDTINRRLDDLTRKQGDIPFASVLKSLKEIHDADDEMANLGGDSFDTLLDPAISEQSEAVEWREGRDGQGGELRRGRQDDSHGSSRHGAQTGTEGQARRAATGGVTPDSRSTDDVTDRVRSAGAPVNIIKWRGADIEWEEVGGKRKVKSRTALKKKLVEEVANNFPSDKGSRFANPVLEKEAVDTAIQKVTAAGWDKIYSNSKGWHDFTSVAVVVGPPKKWKGWGYTVTRKEAATMSVEAADAIIAEFETGKISEQQMLDQLGVEYLTEGGVIKMAPYATVVLKRDDPTKPWKSYTHYPNDDKTAPGWDIEGRKVKKGNGPEQNATF